MSDYEDTVDKTSEEKTEEVVADENLTPEQVKALVEKLKSQITEIQVCFLSFCFHNLITLGRCHTFQKRGKSRRSAVGEARERSQ